MAVLRKRKKKNAPKGYVWIIDYYDNQGKRHWLSTNTASRKVAEQIKAKIEVDLALGKIGLQNVRKRTKLSQFIDSFLQYSEAHHSRSTYELNRRFLNYFLEYKGDVYIDRVTREDVENYKIVRLKEVSRTSVNMELRHLKSAFSYARKVLKCINENPFTGVKQLEISGNNLPAYLNKEEIKRLMEVINLIDFRELVLFYLYTGCRRNEALNLKWFDINMNRRVIAIKKTKGRKDREIPISGKLMDVLQKRTERLKPEPNDSVFAYHPHYVTHKFKKFLELADIEKQASIHTLRHTFASHLVMSGVDLYTVQKLLGHSNLKVTEMYAHLAPDYLAIGIEKLPY